MKKLLVVTAAVAGAVSVLSRRRHATAASDSALWSEAVKAPADR